MRPAFTKAEHDEILREFTLSAIHINKLLARFIKMTEQFSSGITATSRLAGRSVGHTASVISR